MASAWFPEFAKTTPVLNAELISRMPDTGAFVYHSMACSGFPQLL